AASNRPTVDHSYRPFRSNFSMRIAVLLGICFLAACHSIAATPTTTTAPSGEKMSTAYVRLIDPDGKLTEEAVVVPKLVLSDEEWKRRLTPEQYKITRGAGTEAAFCGGLLKNKEAGVYLCVDCGLPLFRSDAKFESGTGWPSFFQPVAPENIR